MSGICCAKYPAMLHSGFRKSSEVFTGLMLAKPRSLGLDSFERLSSPLLFPA
jgi:hypothetical protein